MREKIEVKEIVSYFDQSKTVIHLSHGTVTVKNWGDQVLVSVNADNYSRVRHWASSNLVGQVLTVESDDYGNEEYLDDEEIE